MGPIIAIRINTTTTPPSTLSSTSIPVSSSTIVDSEIISTANSSIFENTTYSNISIPNSVLAEDTDIAGIPLTGVVMLILLGLTCVGILFGFLIYRKLKRKRREESELNESAHKLNTWKEEGDDGDKEEGDDGDEEDNAL